MRLSARNALKGQVKKVTHGAVNSEIVLHVAEGVEITAIITRQSAETLGVAEGSPAYAVVKATDIMVAVD